MEISQKERKKYWKNRKKKKRWEEINQEKHKWFDVTVSDTIVGPWTMVVHSINTPIASTAMMHSFNFATLTYLAYI